MKLLPAWKEIMEGLRMSVRTLPRDVAMRWNSMFDMLDFVLEYRAGIDVITDKNKLGVNQYTLGDEEWELLKQLRNVLKVSACCTAFQLTNITMDRF